MDIEEIDIVIRKITTSKYTDPKIKDLATIRGERLSTEPLQGKDYKLISKIMEAVIEYNNS